MNITINYKEAAVLMSKPASEMKELFLKILDTENINLDDELDLFRLDIYYPNIRSNDPRYDGKGAFSIAAQLSKSKYRKYLSHKFFIENKRLPVGATVFYKICDPLQLKHIEIVNKSHDAYRSRVAQNLKA